MDRIFKNLDLSSTRAVIGTLPVLNYNELELFDITDIIPVLKFEWDSADYQSIFANWATWAQASLTTAANPYTQNVSIFNRLTSV